MKIFKLLALSALLALLLAPVAVYAQEQAAPEHGVIEFGFRGVTGEVYGRTDPGTVPFSDGFRPDLLNSPLNTYYDLRNSFYIPKAEARIDNLFGTKSFLHFQSASNGFAFENGGTLTRDQSILVSFGQYGHYKAQFRFDQTPHIFTGTTRTLFGANGTGGWNVDPNLQRTTYTCLTAAPNAAGIAGCPITNAMFAGFTTSAVNSITRVNATVASLAGGDLGFAGPGLFTQQENRKTFSGSLSWNLNPGMNISALYSRENQTGARPIGFVMGASSSGYVAESPEAIDYDTTNIRFITDFGQEHWSGLLGYQGSLFANNNPSMVVMNPFSTVYNNTTVGPATGRMDLYPDNSYHQFVGQGAADVGKYIHLMASVTPGWMSQNAAFQPLTTNTFVTQTPPGGYPAFLPTTNLSGKVNTLAMNYTAVFNPRKDLSIVAKYQHYDYDNNTPDLLIRPVISDTSYLVSSSFHGSSAGCYDPIKDPTGQGIIGDNSYTYYCPGEQTSFNTKLFDIGGTWFFTKKSSVKFGYQRGWMDRTGREVAETIEDSVYGAVDVQLKKNLMLRVSGRHQNRMPQEYELDTGNVYARMLDQATRVRNRGDVQLQWDPIQKLSISAFWGTLQDNYNQKNAVNSLVPLGNATGSAAGAAGAGVPTPIYGPYYAYGVLNNIGRNYGVDASYALTPKIVLFAEYAREKNTGVFIQGRNGNTPSNNATSCLVAGQSCDPINDLLTAPKDVVNNYYGGVDLTPSKKLDLSMYYSLSLSQSFVFSDGVNCQISSTAAGFCDTHFANWSLDQAANPAVNFGYPQVVNRIHEVGAVARFKLTDNFVPKFQYVFRQFAYNDWQTGVVNPYSFVGLNNDPTGATAVQKLLLLGADQPSYRAHTFSATLEYHF